MTPGRAGKTDTSHTSLLSIERSTVNTDRPVAADPESMIESTPTAGLDASQGEPKYDDDIFQDDDGGGQDDDLSRETRRDDSRSLYNMTSVTNRESRSLHDLARPNMSRSTMLDIPPMQRHAASRGGKEQLSAQMDDDDTSMSRSSMDIVDSQEETMLPPPTQHHSRFDRSGNQTTEQSLINLPSWSFSLSSLTSLSALPSTMRGGGGGAKVNLLVYIKDLDPPFTIQLKKPSTKTGKSTAERASLTVFNESGVTLPIVLWDDFATQWAGQHLLVGDIVYLEKIALSVYMGQKQGTTVDGSRLQICYRTVQTGRRSDRDYKPDLELAWDSVSRRVKALKELATGIA